LRPERFVREAGRSTGREVRGRPSAWVVPSGPITITRVKRADAVAGLRSTWLQRSAQRAPRRAPVTMASCRNSARRRSTSSASARRWTTSTSAGGSTSSSRISSGSAWCGVAADPAPLHRLTERGTHHGMDPMNASSRQRCAVPARLVVTRLPVRTRALVRARRTLARFTPTAWTVLRTRRHRARPVCTGTAPSGQLGVQNVERAGRDPRDVDVVQRPQVPSDDPPVLLKRVRRPATLLHRDPLLGQVTEGAPGMRSVQLSGARPPRRSPGAVRPAFQPPRPFWSPTAACQSAGHAQCRPGAAIGPKGSFRTLAIARRRYAVPPEGGTSGGTPRNEKGPRRAPPTGFEPVSPP
jgi:hypothetical protein